MSNSLENPDLQKARGIESEGGVNLTLTYHTLETPPPSETTGYSRMPGLVEVRIDGKVEAGPLHLKRTLYPDTEINRRKGIALHPVEDQRGYVTGTLGQEELPLDPGSANRLWEQYHQKARESR